MVDGLPKNRLSELRRSSIIGTFGPGAIVDATPKIGGGGGVVSGILCGLHTWDEESPSARTGLNHDQVVSEARLQKTLRVQGFRLPPVISDKDAEDPWANDILPLIRFPRWHVCSKCDSLRHCQRFSPKDGDDKHPILVHRTGKSGGCRGAEAIPVRFVVACKSGHIDDFPWQKWSGCECEDIRGNSWKGFLRSTKAGIGGLVVECAECGNGRAMDDAYSPHKLRDAKIFCSGARPWDSRGWEEGCRESVHVLQRGSSSVYFPDISSVISIPPFTDSISKSLPPTVVNMAMRLAGVSGSRSEFEGKIRGAFEAMMVSEDEYGHPIDRVVERLGRWYEAMQGNPEEAPERWREWVKLTDPLTSGDATIEPDFEVRKEDHDEFLDPVVEGVVAANRIREVRALAGFSRVEPSKGLLRVDDNLKTVDLAEEVDRKWLPAVEINGEGVMIVLREGAVREWESSDKVVSRVEAMKERMGGNLREGETLENITPRLIMLHTFAHALMRQLTLSSGYSTAALKERIYSSGIGDFRMAGVLICTGSPDSEGTLGGLVRQARPDLIRSVIEGLMKDLSWCSSDPVCIDGTISLSTPLNGAACHACVLAPETSCEYQNLALDRALLVGTPDDPDIGFLSRLDAGQEGP